MELADLGAKPPAGAVVPAPIKPRRLHHRWPALALVVALIAALAAPLATGAAAPGFFLEVLLGGLMSGVLYALVALGFVLIYKSSGVFNFAQGAMVLFAALATARLAEHMPLVLAFLVALALMIALAWVVERLVLRPLVNQDPVVLLMATLGVTYFLDGFGQTVWGADVYTIDLGLPKEPIIVLQKVFDGGILVNRDDLVAAAVVALLVLLLALFFQKTSTGRALRAVADDHQAAQSIGIALNRIWVIVWSVAGFVALVAGMVWGSKLGVQFSLAQVALKALPVVILGGLDSVPGAVVGGLIIGVGEKMAEVFLGPALVRSFSLSGAGIENWFAYVLALLFLLVRPEGLFGERRIDRV
jgi:branched-chain amino acid transport system permease protein